MKKTEMDAISRSINAPHYNRTIVADNRERVSMTTRKSGLTERERILFDNSIERVINTTLQLLEHIAFKDTVKEELRSVNVDDWHNLKSHVVDIWNEARNEAFKRLNNPTIDS
jgi:hypothetical protein